MKISCLHCQHRFKIKPKRPGRFCVACPGCREKVRVELAVSVFVLDENGTRVSDTVRNDQTRSNKPVAQPNGHSLHERLANASGSTIGGASVSESTMERSEAEPNDIILGADHLFDSEATMESSDGEDVVTEPGRGSSSESPILGGYEVLQKLGAGAMGNVYLARQISLDREVAIKTIQSRIAADPRAMARFTREAFSAAQLTHPNVIQIYDMGMEQDVHYFSMEFVRGRNLRDEVKTKGRMLPDVALKVILQAARGLRHAHQAGMVHRDVKPENLMLSDDGFVKVADLGLVKVVGDSDEQRSEEDSQQSQCDAELTNAESAMGTPAYMSPEQAEAAADVDDRSDMYSLGCTLYTLVTGDPPFVGSTVNEVITKHKSEPLKRPDVVLKHVPSELGELTEQMTAKHANDRIQSMDALIGKIETLLGLDDSDKASAEEQNLESLESCTSELAANRLARVQRIVRGLILLLASALTVLGLLTSWVSPSSGAALIAFMIGAMAVGSVTYAVLSSLLRRSVLGSRLRQLVFSIGVRRWFLVTSIVAIFVVVGTVCGQIPLILFGGMIGGAVAVALSLLVDVPADRNRHAAIAKLEPTLKRMRMQGLEESAVQSFVAKYAGEQWEEPFELLFGYDDKIRQREQLLGQERFRRMPRYAGWRDPVIRWIDGKLRQAADRTRAKHLSRVEAASLVAEGKDPEDAKEIAQHLSLSMVSESRRTAMHEDPSVARLKRKKQYDEALRHARSTSSTERIFRRIGRLTDGLVGTTTRTLLGCCLAAAFGYRILQSDLVHKKEWTVEAILRLGNDPLPMIRVPGVPDSILSLLTGWSAGLAGGLLLVSSFFVASRRGGMFVVLGAIVCLVGSPISLPLVESFVPGVFQDALAGLLLAFGGSWLAHLVPLPGRR